jgi:hypothetical protein
MNGDLMDTHWTARLSEYLDGELGERERTACAAHLERCAECARVLAALTAVKERVAALPALAAPADLWSAIAARLEPAAESPRVHDLAAARARRWTFSFSAPAFAAAAAGLVLVTAAVMWTAARFGVLPGVSTPATTQAPLAANSRGAAPGVQPPVSLVPPAGGRAARFADAGVEARTVDFGMEKYDLAIADLERVLAEHRSELDTTTVRVLEKNLALIDAAIADARRALAADPASPYLNGYLASTMKRKVELLRRLTAALRT